MTARKIKASEPNFQLTKKDFGLKNKAHDWEAATWSWILKRGYMEYEQGDPTSYREITLNKIKVSVWPEHYKPYDPNLDMDFDPGMDGLAESRRYARTAIDSGAVLAEIRMSVNFPWKFNVLAQAELYKLDEPTPIDPRDL
jgi:hypothetical protein